MLSDKAFKDKFKLINENKAQKMCAKCRVATTLSHHVVFDVLFYERKDCPLKVDSEATIDSLSS